MSQWGKNDNAANSVLWAVSQLKKTANSTTRGNLFGNTTANAFIAGVTVGQYAVDTNEIAAQSGSVAHTGWVLRTEGQGGRAGRIQTEVLVAGGITADAEDTAYPDYTITITSQPADSEEDAGTEVEFAVVATSVPSTTLSYQWQVSTDDGDTWASVSGGNYSGGTTATLTVADNTGLDGYQYRAAVSKTGATTVYSDAAVLTIAA